MTVWSDAAILFGFASWFVFGWFVSKAYYKSKNKEVKYKCCDHCYDPATGNQHEHEVIPVDSHMAPCTEPDCEAGQQRV